MPKITSKIKHKDGTYITNKKAMTTKVNELHSLEYALQQEPKNISKKSAKKMLPTLTMEISGELDDIWIFCFFMATDTTKFLECEVDK